MANGRGSRQAITGDWGYPTADLAALAERARVANERLVVTCFPESRPLRM